MEIIEVPQYTIKPDINRMVAPWALKLIGISTVFYVGIYLNLYLLKIEMPPYINMFILAFLIVLIVAQSIIYHVKFARYRYLVYVNRVDYEGKTTKTFLFDDFQQAELKKNLFDSMFSTGTIVLDKDFVIGPISDSARIKEYIEKLADYHRQSLRGAVR